MHHPTTTLALAEHFFSHESLFKFQTPFTTLIMTANDLTPNPDCKTCQTQADEFPIAIKLPSNRMPTNATGLHVHIQGATCTAQYVITYIVISPEQPFGTPYGTLARLLLTAIGCCLLLPRKLGVATDRRQIP
jgi:hypothetical protein